MRILLNYEIIKSEEYEKGSEIVLGHNPNNEISPYVTWCCKNKNDYYFGHYIKNKNKALEDYHTRLKEKYSCPW